MGSEMCIRDRVWSYKSYSENVLCFVYSWAQGRLAGRFSYDGQTVNGTKVSKQFEKNKLVLRSLMIVNTFVK